jgi:thiol-disulfide isomerase/thioredoxin
MRRASTLTMIPLIVSLLLLAPQSPADAAREKFRQAEELTRSDKFAEAAALFHQAAQLDPTYLDAHYQTIWASVAADYKNRDQVRARLRAEYEALLRGNPNSAVLHAALARVLGNPNGEPEIRKALELDPKLISAWQDLAIALELKGDNAGSLEALERAAATAPDDPNPALYAVMKSRDISNDEFRRRVLAFVDKWPNHTRSSQALYWLGQEAARDTEDQIAIYERLRRDFPFARFPWSENAMSDLFDLYADRDPAKALTLIDELAANESGKREPGDWREIRAFQHELVKARRLLDENHPAQALALLDNLKPYPRMHPLAYHLYKAEAAAAAGHLQRAYDDLAKLAAADPRLPFLKALDIYAAKLNRKPADDLWTLRQAAAKPAAELNLPRFDSAPTATWKDFQGKVVLLNFWYPGCGPCRREFTLLKSLPAKYPDSRFVIVAVNTVPEEEPLVLPMLQKNGYRFLPLKGDSDWAEATWQVKGNPTNYLIGGDGRVYAKPKVYNAEALATLERFIQSLLDHTTR